MCWRMTWRTAAQRLQSQPRYHSASLPACNRHCIMLRAQAVGLPAKPPQHVSFAPPEQAESACSWPSANAHRVQDEGLDPKPHHGGMCMRHDTGGICATC